MRKNTPELAVREKRWSNRWTPVRSLLSGNQGLAYEARDASGRTAFVKALSDHRITERRERFYREVQILGDVDLPGIPRILESNAEYHHEPDYELYFAAEFIRGQRLTEVALGGSLSTSQIIRLIRDICIVLQASHEKGVVHRDVKPENIMVARDTSGLRPFVVDFGMAHFEDVNEDTLTTTGQEIGNRFLRLPEHASGSQNKRDARSDVTACAGLLLFMLTRIRPSLLRDDADRAPHQRHRERLMLQAIDVDSDALLNLFDTAFKVDISKRFQTIAALVAALETLRPRDDVVADDEEFLVRRLQHRFGARAADKEKLTAATDLVCFVGSSLQRAVAECGGVLTITQSPLVSEPDRISRTYTVEEPADSLKSSHLSIEAKIVAAEIQLSILDGENVQFVRRISVDASMTEDDKRAVRRHLLSRIEFATSDERFYTPRSIEASRFFPGGEKAPGFWVDEEEATCEYRPALKVSWYPPRTVNGTLMIAWDIVNIGQGPAYAITAFVAGLVQYDIAELRIGQRDSVERRFDDRSAYHEFMRGKAHAIFEFADRCGNLYRQCAVISSGPKWEGVAADYYTTQLGYPFLTEARMIQPIDRDAFYCREPIAFVR